MIQGLEQAQAFALKGFVAASDHRWRDAATNFPHAIDTEGLTARVYTVVSATILAEQMTKWTEDLRLTNITGQTTFSNQFPASTSQRFFRAKEL